MLGHTTHDMGGEKMTRQMTELEKYAGIVIQFLDRKGFSNTWVRQLTDLVANYGYTDIDQAKDRADKLVLRTFDE